MTEIATVPVALPNRRRTATLPLRRVRFGVALLVTLVAAASALGYLSWANLQRADDWRERATSTSMKLASTETNLAKSETEVDRLETRLGDVSDEKADVEDEKAQAIEERDFLGKVAQLSLGIADDLDSCVNASNELIRLIVSATSYDSSYVLEQARRTDSLCRRAQSANRDLNDLLGR